MSDETSTEQPPSAYDLGQKRNDQEIEGVSIGQQSLIYNEDQEHDGIIDGVEDASVEQHTLVHKDDKDFEGIIDDGVEGTVHPVTHEAQSPVELIDDQQREKKIDEVKDVFIKHDSPVSNEDKDQNGIVCSVEVIETVVEQASPVSNDAEEQKGIIEDVSIEQQLPISNDEQYPDGIIDGVGDVSEAQNSLVYKGKNDDDIEELEEIIECVEEQTSFAPEYDEERKGKNDAIEDMSLTTNINKMQTKVTQVEKTSNLQLKQHKEITIGGIEIRGSCMSINGDYFFTDYESKNLMNIEVDGTLKYKMSTNFKAFDFTFVKEQTVAITSGETNLHSGIALIDVETQSQIKFIELLGRPFGIACYQDSLFVCVEKFGIYELATINHDNTRCVIRSYLPWYSYIHVSSDRIYYTDYTVHSVYCCNRQGSPLWTFRDDSILKYPRGVTVDNDGNVYVVGETSSNVVIISNDGKQILTKVEGLNEPSSIFFNQQNRTLLVANKRNNAFLYTFK